MKLETTQNIPTDKLYLVKLKSGKTAILCRPWMYEKDTDSHYKPKLIWFDESDTEVSISNAMDRVDLSHEFVDITGLIKP